MPKVLVTGGAGFIGSHIVDLLLSKNYEVAVVDDFSTGTEANIKHALEKINVVNADIRNYDAVKNLFDSCNFDYVLHQAALRSVPDSLRQPELYFDVNVKGTLNILEASRNTGVKRVVFASSCAVYGNVKKLPAKEGKEGIRISPYAVSKYTCEDLCKFFCEIYGLETVSLRYFNVFGPRQDLKSNYATVIPVFINELLSNRQPVVFGDGEQTRDFTYVENIAQANLFAMTAKKAKGKVLNASNQEQVSINQILSKINRILGKNMQPKYEPWRMGDVKHIFADNSKAKKIIGYQNFVSFDEGLKRTVDWMKERKID